MLWGALQLTMCDVIVNRSLAYPWLSSQDCIWTQSEFHNFISAHQLQGS